MKLNINDVLKTPGLDKELDLQMILPDEGEEALSGPVTLRGKLQNRAGAVTLGAVIEADLQVRCARCDISVQKTLRIELSRLVAASLEDPENEEILLAPGGELDIDELVRQELLLGEETVYLCADDCKGLCPSCGKDLNEETCACAGKNVDPRLAALLDLLEDKHEQ